jgi:hypothetical protein
MSKWTAEEVLKHAKLSDEQGLWTRADMLREYAAHLTAQAEWPSEEDERVALSAAEKWARENGFVAYMVPTGYMRAALQSARPPVGVVSEPEWIGSLRNELMQSKSTHNFTFTRDEVMALLASRHAPTKD